jgi:hypothetical protein
MTDTDVQALVSRSLRNRVMVAYALCAMAEAEAHDGHLNRALQTVVAVRQLMAEIRILIGEPNTMSSSAVREAADLFAELETRIDAIEAAMGPRILKHRLT